MQRLGSPLPSRHSFLAGRLPPGPFPPSRISVCLRSPESHSSHTPPSRCVREAVKVGGGEMIGKIRHSTRMTTRTTSHSRSESSSFYLYRASVDRRETNQPRTEGITKPEKENRKKNISPKRDIISHQDKNSHPLMRQIRRVVSQHVLREHHPRRPRLAATSRAEVLPQL